MAKRYPDCAIVMQGKQLNEAEEQLRQERVKRNLQRFREAELYFEKKRTEVMS